MPRYNGGFIGTDGLDAPDPPTDVTPTGGDSQLSIAFTAPTDTGTSAITGFVAQVSTNGTDYSAGSNTGTSSPIVVSSLSNGTSYTAKVWAINAYGTSAPSDASSAVEAAVPVGTRAIFGPAYVGANSNQIDTVLIPTTGNATDWGDFAISQYGTMHLSNTNRIVSKQFHDGTGSENKVNIILYHSWAASGGTWSDFGDTSASGPSMSCFTLANDTRGLIGSGVPLNSSSLTQTVEYVTIGSTGNTQDFGDLDQERRNLTGYSSQTRGICAGGRSSGGTYFPDISYFTIGSTGNSSDYGDLQNSVRELASCSSSTRGLIAGGFTGSTPINTIDYGEIASTGNTDDFGDLSIKRMGCAGASSKTRGLFAGGQTDGFGAVNSIDYLTIASTGNATDFGDLQSTKQSYEEGGASNAHGGLA